MGESEEGEEDDEDIILEQNILMSASILRRCKETWLAFV